MQSSQQVLALGSISKTSFRNLESRTRLGEGLVVHQFHVIHIKTLDELLCLLEQNGQYADDLAILAQEQYNNILHAADTEFHNKMDRGGGAKHK